MSSDIERRRRLLLASYEDGRRKFGFWKNSVVGIVLWRKRLDSNQAGLVKQHSTDACCLIVSQERHGNDKRTSPFGTRFGNGTADEKLIEIFLASDRGLVDFCRFIKT